jgi:hypothetical protein
MRNSDEKCRRCIPPGPNNRVVTPSLVGRFFAKDLSKQQVGFESVPNYRLLVARKTAKSETYRSPQAYPNFREESVVILPALPGGSAASAISRFLVFHEIEHVTVEGVKREHMGHSLEISFLVFFIFFSFGIDHRLVPALAAILLFFIGTVEFLLLLPAQLEAATDLRALSLLEPDEIPRVAQELISSFTAREAAVIHEKRWLTNLSARLEIPIRVGLVQSIWQASQRLRIPLNTATQKLASRPLSGCILALPAVTLFWKAGVTFSTYGWFSILPFALALPILFVLQGLWGAEGDVVLAEIRSLIPREVANQDSAYMTSD